MELLRHTDIVLAYKDYNHRSVDVPQANHLTHGSSNDREDFDWSSRTGHRIDSRDQSRQ